MIHTFRSVLVLTALSALLACGVNPEPTSSPNESADPSVQVVEVADAADAPGAARFETDTASVADTFNPCTCLNLSQVLSCGSGSTCTAHRASGTESHFCSSTGKFYTCTHYVAYTCRAYGYAPSGLPCCSGHAAYVGSTLLCR